MQVQEYVHDDLREVLEGMNESLIGLVDKYLPDHDTDGLDISVTDPRTAIRRSMDRAKAGDERLPRDQRTRRPSTRCRRSICPRCCS